MWLSTTKYLVPSFSYTCPPWWCGSGVCARPAAVLLRERLQVESVVVRPILGVREPDGPVVLVDHPAVVGEHVLLELGGVEVALLLAEGLGDLVVLEVHPVRAVDPHHRRQRCHRHPGLVPYDLGDHGPDLVVHQGDAAPVGRLVVVLERTLGRLERGHWVSSFGTLRLSSDRIPANRFFARSRQSSKRGGLASGWDHSGCSSRAATRHRGTQAESHCSR